VIMSTSILNIYRKPVVFFNAKDPDHRKWVAEFHRRGTWHHCPVMFYGPRNVSVRAYTAENLLQYYMQQEFLNDKKPRKLFKVKQESKNA